MSSKPRKSLGVQTGRAGSLCAACLGATGTDGAHTQASTPCPVQQLPEPGAPHMGVVLGANPGLSNMRRHSYFLRGQGLPCGSGSSGQQDHMLASCQRRDGNVAPVDDSAYAGQMGKEGSKFDKPCRSSDPQNWLEQAAPQGGLQGEVKSKHSIV